MQTCQVMCLQMEKCHEIFSINLHEIVICIRKNGNRATIVKERNNR